jgi:uncharacterized coiled-coil protein SlyX
MGRTVAYLPRVAIFVAGVAAGTIAGARRLRRDIDPKLAEELTKSLADLEARTAAQHSETAGRLHQVEVCLAEHEARLKEVPSTADIVSAMEQLLSKTMSSLDERMNTQASSIESLKSTVTQTDGLLERVLESLDSLQASPEVPAQSAGAAEEKQAFQKMVSSLEDRFADHTKEFETLRASVAQKEDSLTRVLASLDQRVGSQGRSLDALKATVAQTDSLLERVLESLDSMHTAPGGEDTLLRGRG